MIRQILAGAAIAAAALTIGTTPANAHSYYKFYGPTAFQQCQQALHQVDPTGTTTSHCDPLPGAENGYGLAVAPSVDAPGDAPLLSAQGFAQRLARILVTGSASASQ